jgi:hypothetical protein
VGNDLQMSAPKVVIPHGMLQAQHSNDSLFDGDEVRSLKAAFTRNKEYEPISHREPCWWTAN